MKELGAGYRAFFESKPGEELLKFIEDVIVSSHEKAEKEPELARDYVQRAKGSREVLEHINSILAERKPK